MPISALSSSTVRLLGSSAAIVTPCHLVKELLENAIDAGATSIEVNISANTVDRIQVRDNGHGIDFNDFDCLGRPDHTSKMTCFEDLQIKGVSTLGFRGQALASAACLAGICITTRTKQDPVASRLTLVPGLGGVQERKPISAPVGTTVNASKLFNALPVRKQQALKDSNKTLAKIKSLLQSYSLARCHVKLTFKVVGEARPRWAYSPSQFPTIEDAATQVFGISIASYYLHLSHEVTGSSERVTLQVLMPKPRCDLLSLKAVGVYINVNGRPIDSSRGLARKIAKLFRSCITKDRTIGSSVPFLHMSIVASPGSYDPNISAAKDEVLFPDEQQLLDDFEAMCNRVYTYSEASEDSIDALPLENLDTRNTSTPVVEKSQSGLPKLSSVTQADVPSPTVSRMRTAMRVDLSRKISDATDDATIVDMVDIQVPPREDPKRRDEKCPTSKTEMDLSAGTIDHYFRRRGPLDFDILEDEPNTSAQETEVSHQQTPESTPARKPLLELKGPWLNRADMQARSPEAGNPDSPESPQGGAFKRSPRATEDGSNGTMLNGPGRSLLRHAERMTLPLESLTPRRSSNGQGLRSPPSSAQWPSRRTRGSSPIRPRGIRPSRETVRSVRVHSPNFRRQAVESRLPASLSHHLQGAPPLPPAETSYPQYAPRRESAPHGELAATANHESMWQSDDYVPGSGPTNFLENSLQTRASRPSVPLSPSPYTHFAQVRLMQTPMPATRASSVAPDVRGEAGLIRRLSSSGLPLGKIPAGKETHTVVLNLHVKDEEFLNLVNVNVDDDDIYWGSCNVSSMYQTDLKAATRVTHIQYQLRRLVDSWMETQ